MPKDFLQDRNARQRFVDGAARYAEADRSDPFAFSRAAAHARVGLLEGDEYDAEAHVEVRAIQSREHGRVVEYNARVWRGVKRA